MKEILIEILNEIKNEITDCPIWKKESKCFCTCDYFEICKRIKKRLDANP